jgi:hypothetical protein
MVFLFTYEIRRATMTVKNARKVKRRIVSTFEIVYMGGPVVIDRPFRILAHVRIHENNRSFPVEIKELK